jgi:hypothetical protein
MELGFQISTGDPGYVAEFGTSAVSAFSVVTHVMPHVVGPIVHPRMACRLGTYTDSYGVGNTDFGFLPFPSLLAVWGSYGKYKACVAKNTDLLRDAGLWDTEIGEEIDRAEKVERLFRQSN